MITTITVGLLVEPGVATEGPLERGWLAAPKAIPLDSQGSPLTKNGK